MVGDLSHGEYRDAGGPELAAQHHDLVISRMSAAACPPASSQRGSSVLRREGHKSRSRLFAAVAAIGPMVFLVVMPGSGATQASALSDADAAAQ